MEEIDKAVTLEPISKREFFAALMAQGMLAGPKGGHLLFNENLLVDSVVHAADALIKELDNDKR